MPPHTAAVTAPRDQIILGAIIAAARAGDACPTNEVLTEALGAASTSTVVESLQRLSDLGLIRIERTSARSRVVRIPSIGLQTARPDALAHVCAPLADLVAQGVPLYTAGKRLGLSPGAIARAWQRIRDELGPQAV